MAACARLLLHAHGSRPPCAQRRKVDHAALSLTGTALLAKGEGMSILVAVKRETLAVLLRSAVDPSANSCHRWPWGHSCCVFIGAAQTMFASRHAEARWSASSAWRRLIIHHPLISATRDNVSSGWSKMNQTPSRVWRATVSSAHMATHPARRIVR